MAADPFSAFAAQFGGGLGRGIGDAIGGGGGPFIGGSSAAMAYGTTLDGSGWIVNIGSGKQDAVASPVRTTTNSPAIDTGSTGLPQEFGIARAGLGTLPALLLLSVFAAFILKRAKS